MDSSRFSIALLIGSTILFSSACGKKAAEDAETAGAAVEEGAPASVPIKGGAEVLAAVNRKDYQGAVGSLAAIKAGITPGQRDEYIELRRTVSEALVAAMATDPRAAEAYKVLRVIETGR